MEHVAVSRKIGAVWQMAMVLAWCVDPHAPAVLHGFQAACVVATVASLAVGDTPSAPVLPVTAVLALLAAIDATDVYWWPALVAVLDASTTAGWLRSSRVLAQR